MATFAKFIISTLTALMLSSCVFDPGVSGNGNVTTQNRSTDQNFSEIEAANGLEVLLTQGNSYSIVVEADENLQELIKTEINGNTLEVYTTRNISNSASKKVMITFKTLKELETSSGSHVESTNKITGDNLALESSSGSHLELDISAKSLSCDVSSGSHVVLFGTIENLSVDASSGSHLDAEQLQAEDSKVSASSGSTVTVNTSKKLVADASSGSSVNYMGNPESVNVDSDVSGSVNKKD